MKSSLFDSQRIRPQIITGIVMILILTMLGVIALKETGSQLKESNPVKSMEATWLSDKFAKELIDHPIELDTISFKNDILTSPKKNPCYHTKTDSDPEKGYYAMKLRLFSNSYENLILHIDGIFAESFRLYSGDGKLLYEHDATKLTKNYTVFLSEAYVHSQSEIMYVIASHNIGNRKIGFTLAPTLMNTDEALVYMTDNAQARHSVALFLLLLSIILVFMSFALARDYSRDIIKHIAIFTGLFGLWILTDFSRHGFWILNSFSITPPALLIFVFIISKNYMTCAFVKMNGFFLEKETSKKIVRVLVVLTFILGTLETIIDTVRFFKWNPTLILIEKIIFFAMDWTIILGCIGLLGLAAYESYRGSIRAVVLSCGLGICLFTFFISQTTSVLISHWGVIALLSAISLILSSSYAEAQRKSKQYTEVLRTKNEEMEQLNKDLDYAQTELLLRLGGTVDLRSHETSMHVQRVSMYTKLIAEKIGLEEENADLIAKASTLHDVGKVGTPDSILNSPKKLSEEEYIEMKRHAKMGYEILNGSMVQILDIAAIVALTHHERYDGKGYPDGLSGEDIPLQGRIVAAADVFDALLSSRVYKRSWSLDEVIAYFKEEAGKHFDPKIAKIIVENREAFEEIIKTVPYED